MYGDESLESDVKYSARRESSMATSHYRVMSSIAPGESRVWRRVIIE